MSCQRPVLFHDTAGSSHAARHQLVKKSLEISSRLDRSRIKVFAGDILDGIGIVDDAARLDADREAIYLVVNGDGLGRLACPVFTGQIQRMLRSQGIDILRVHHGNGVRLIGGISRGQMSSDRVTGIIGFDIHTLLFGILCRFLLQLVLDLHLGVEDRDRNAAAGITSAGRCTSSASAACQQTCCQHSSCHRGSSFLQNIFHNDSPSRAQCPVCRYPLSASRCCAA